MLPDRGSIPRSGGADLDETGILATSASLAATQRARHRRPERRGPVSLRLCRGTTDLRVSLRRSHCVTGGLALSRCTAAGSGLTDRHAR